MQPTVTKEATKPQGRAVTIGLLAILGVVLLALIPRLYFLYVATDPDVMVPSWSNDTWHRWQIAYLSKDVGFSRGFLRLWDFKGMEYYWGILHPLVLTGIFSVTGSVDIMILRWLTIAAGVGVVLLLYMISRRHVGGEVAIAVALLAALNPIAIFNDVSGMVEPISFVLLLASIYFFPRRSLLAGVFLALAAMTRAEAWLLSAGLLVAVMLRQEATHRKVVLALGWAAPVGLYMKYLLDKTGNAIYPIYWNFLANAAGEWEFRETYTDYQLAARPVLVCVFAAAILGLLWVLLRQPKMELLHLLGFASTGFTAGFIGLTAYLLSYEPWFWLTRFFVFSYLFAGVLLAVIALGWLPDRSRWWRKLGLGWVVVLVALLAMQLTWSPILYDAHQGFTSRTSMENLKIQGEFVAQFYEGGTVLVPEGNAQLTYAMVRYGGLEGIHMLSQMYGPIHYYQGEDPYADWETVGPEMWDWFEREQIMLLVMDSNDQRFLTMIEDRPDRFEYAGAVPNSGFLIYRVVPQ
ncbi:MAG: hypothetical protein PVF70_10010 [Anaerolineales bacterium]